MKNLKQLLNESADLFEDELFEDSDDISSEKQMSEEDLKVESLKIATNIAKLMSDVTPDDILQIASKVSDFIKNHEIGKETTDKEEKKEDEFDFVDELK